jgi:hypothetical protein
MCWWSNTGRLGKWNDFLLIWLFVDSVIAKNIRQTHGIQIPGAKHPNQQLTN